MTWTIKRVGFVGLGIMGSAMMRNTAAAGFAITGYDPDPAAMQKLEEQGGVPAASPGDTAALSDVVVVSLATEAAFEAVIYGKDGLRQSPVARVVIETSTLPLASKLKARDALAEAGCIMLDCPVSGTGAQAAKKQITAFVSGDHAATEHCRPVIEAFTRTHTRLGAFGSGTIMKFLANYLVSIHGAAAAEVMALGVKAGIEPKQIYDTLCDSAATSRIFEVRGPLMIAGAYEPPTARIDMFLKDLKIIGEFAESLSVPSWLFSAARQYYTAARAKGMGNQDVAAIFDVCVRLASDKHKI